MHVHVHTKSACRIRCKASEPVSLCKVGYVVFSNQLLECPNNQYPALISNPKWVVAFLVEFNIGLSWMLLLHQAWLIN